MKDHGTGVVVGGLVVIMLAVFAQSYEGRVHLIASERQMCERVSRNVIDVVNADRADIVGNSAVAADPRQPLRTRQARHAEVVTQLRVIGDLDGRVDQSLVGGLSKADRLLALKSGFRCDRAFPAASPLP